jgi:hypothetical protein
VKQPIPDAALDDRLGFVGTAGSGKSYNAMGRVERLLERKARVAIVDPLGVFWGLRLYADGKTKSGFDIPIFGGPHGDLPLTEHSGALIGETAAGMAESCIIDLSEIGTKAGERRFMLHFLTALYRKASGEPLHLVIDEADMFAPQKLTDKDGEAAKLLGMMETVVRRGRIKGFIPWLLTQRPAVIAKDVLSQVDGLVAFKLTSSQDRNALGAWVEGTADNNDWPEMKAKLPSMERGQGVVWIPGRGILETVSFPEKITFDSSRTPKRGEKKSTAALTPLDLGKLKDRLAAVDAETKANDPKALKAEIAALRKEVTAKALIAQNAAPDPRAIRDAEVRGLEEGFVAAMRLQAKAIEAISIPLNSAAGELSAWNKRLSESVPVRPSGSPPSQAFNLSPAKLTAPAREAVRAAPRKPMPAASGNGAWNSPQRRVLDSLAFWRTIGHEMPSREQVASVAGYSPGSGNFNNLLGGLRAHGAIDYPATGSVALAIDHESNMDADDARRMLDKILTGPQQKILEAMRSLGSHASREQIAEASGYSAGSGNFNNLLGQLRTLCVIDYPRTGEAQITDWAGQVLG